MFRFFFVEKYILLHHIDPLIESARSIFSRLSILFETDVPSGVNEF